LAYCYTGENSLDAEAAIDLQPHIHSRIYIYTPVIHFLAVNTLRLNTATFNSLVYIPCGFSFRSSYSHRIYITVLRALVTLLCTVTVRRHQIACARAYEKFYGRKSFLSSQLRTQIFKNFPEFCRILILFVCALVPLTGPPSNSYKSSPYLVILFLFLGFPIGLFSYRLISYVQ
jgi:hypothetical protein